MQLSEYEIIEIAENVCNLKKREADWILKIDIVEKGDKLEVKECTFEMFITKSFDANLLTIVLIQLVEQDSEGQCNSECKTIERACQEVRLSRIDICFRTLLSRVKLCHII